MKLLNRIGFPNIEKSFALNQLDLKLKKFMNFSYGFFIETGANDGKNQSNTLYFELYKDWTGILIEPIPELAALCRRNRPKCIVENCALVEFEFEEPVVEMWHCGLMSLVKGALKSEEAELNHIKKGISIQSEVENTYLIKVPAVTLTSVLEKYDVSQVDLFSLDVEGFELNVLKGLDFDRYKPKFMLIETRYRDEIEEFLKPLYEPIAELSHHDVLYKSNQ